MGCLVLGGEEQMELVKLWTGPKKASWRRVGEWGWFFTPLRILRPHLYLPQQMQTPPFTAELSCFPWTPRSTEGWGDTLPTLGTWTEAIHVAAAC